MNTTKPFLLVRQLQPGGASQANSPGVQNHPTASLSPERTRSLKLIQRTSKMSIQGMSMKSLYTKLPDIRPKESTSNHESAANTERYQHNRAISDKKIVICRNVKFTPRKLDKIQPTNRKCVRRIASFNISSHRSLGLQVFSREGRLDGFTEIDES